MLPCLSDVAGAVDSIVVDGLGLPVVLGLGDVLGVGLAACGAGVGLDALLGTGGSRGDLGRVLVVGLRNALRVAVAARADEYLYARLGAGSLLGYLRCVRVRMFVLRRLRGIAGLLCRLRRGSRLVRRLRSRLRGLLFDSPFLTL